MKKKHIYKVPDMSCGHCVNRITALLGSMGAKGFEVSLEQQRIYSEEPLEEKVIKALEESGYPVAAE